MRPCNLVVSYLPSTVTMAQACITSEIKQDIGRKLRFIHTPMHSTQGGPRRNTAIPFGLQKLEKCGYPTVVYGWIRITISTGSREPM